MCCCRPIPGNVSLFLASKSTQPKALETCGSVAWRMLVDNLPAAPFHNSRQPEDHARRPPFPWRTGRSFGAGRYLTECNLQVCWVSKMKNLQACLHMSTCLLIGVATPLWLLVDLASVELEVGVSVCSDDQAGRGGKNPSSILWHKKCPELSRLRTSPSYTGRKTSAR